MKPTPGAFTVDLVRAGYGLDGIPKYVSSADALSLQLTGGVLEFAGEPLARNPPRPGASLVHLF